MLEKYFERKRKYKSEMDAHVKAMSRLSDDYLEGLSEIVEKASDEDFNTIINSKEIGTHEKIVMVIMREGRHDEQDKECCTCDECCDCGK